MLQCNMTKIRVGPGVCQWVFVRCTKTFAGPEAEPQTRSPAIGERPDSIVSHRGLELVPRQAASGLDGVLTVADTRSFSGDRAAVAMRVPMP